MKIHHFQTTIFKIKILVLIIFLSLIYNYFHPCYITCYHYIGLFMKMIQPFDEPHLLFYPSFKY